MTLIRQQEFQSRIYHILDFSNEFIQFRRTTTGKDETLYHICQK